MGTIAEKLTYLNTTKTMLKDSLNKFGSNILTTDTFRSYDTKLNDIYNKLPKITQSGAGFTLENVQNGQVDDFKMIGTDLEQNTTTGKNLLNPQISSYESNGVSISYNNETQTITLNGTCTQNNTVFSFSETTGINNFTVNSGDTVYALIKYISGIETGNFFLGLYDNTWAKNVIVKTTTELTEDLAVSKTFYETVTFNKFRLRCENGTTFDNLKIKVYLSTIDDVYEQYTGKIPAPNPDYPQDIKVVEGRQVITDKGKNLFDKDNANIIVASFSQDYKTISQVSNNAKILYISCKENTTYTVSKISSARFRILTTDIVPALDVTGIDFIQNETSTSLTITTSSNVNYLCVYYFINGTDTLSEQEILNSIQIEEGPTATDYEPYYEPVSYNIDLQLANIYLAKMPDTTYKNRIYKNNGNWYYEKNIEKVVLDGSEDEVWTTFKNSIILNGLWSGKPITMCDSFKETTNELWVSDSDDYRGMCSSLNTAGQFRCMPLNDMTLSDFKTWLSTHNVTLWYPLDNPITTQITNTTLINQLEAISVHTGTNIITISNDNNIIPEIEITRLKELEKLS